MLLVTDHQMPNLPASSQTISSVWTTVRSARSKIWSSSTRHMQRKSSQPLCFLITLRGFFAQKSHDSSRLGASNQAGLLRALNSNISDDSYNEILAFASNGCGKEGIDKILYDNEFDSIIGPEDGPMFAISGSAGMSIFHT